MAGRPTDSGAVTDSPEAIRAAMEQTRAAITNDLAALKGRILDPRRETSRNGSKTVAKAKPKTATATKPAAAKAGTKSKTAAGKTSTGGTAVKKAATTTVKKMKSAGSKLLKEAKAVLSDVLAGAASGAVKGAAGAVAEHVEDVADGAQKVAVKAKGLKDKTPAKGSTPAKKK